MLETKFSTGSIDRQETSKIINFFSSLYFWAFTDLNGIVPVLVYVSLPIAVIKSGIALVQLVYAARNLAELDAIQASKKQ